MSVTTEPHATLIIIKLFHHRVMGTLNDRDRTKPPPFGGTEGGFLRDYSGASVNFTFPLMSVLELPTYAVKRPGSLTQS